MQIAEWLKDRSTKGTLAATARRMAAESQRYEDLSQLRDLFILEHLVRNGGNQRKTAVTLGISRNIVNRTLRSLAVQHSEIRKLAQAIQEGNHGGN